MKNAIRHLALDGAGGQAIVVCADIAEYARGSSGEPTQGAGAIAMLLEEDPQLVEVDLLQSGSASDYRIMDFRKPMLRFCGQDRSESNQVQDFPVFNGKYSTTCYIDETLHALNDMYEKRGLIAADYLRSLKTVFMHRPYRRMPETGYAVAYLFALGNGSAEDRAELASFCYEAGVELDGLLAEMSSKPEIVALADPERLNFEAYPLTMAVFRIFRASRRYRREILDKLALGSDTMLDLGNLYTAALPAWIAAGFEQAADENLDMAGEELLTLGYGSGDAAEVIPFMLLKAGAQQPVRFNLDNRWNSQLILTKTNTWHCTPAGARKNLDFLPNKEFVIDKIGRTDERQFQDVGIEYYKYVN